MIGLIFGDTDFPKEILKTIKKNKIKYLIIDLSKSKKFKKDKKSFAVSMGQFGKIINILKENNCKKVLFAGKVNKPKFSKLKLDLKGIYYIPRIIKASKLGDAAILREIIKILAQNKIKTENSLTFNPKLSLKKGNYSKIKPNKQDQLDIKKAIKTLNNLRQYNFSQGVVVRNKKVVSIEGKGGTKIMLEKSRSKKFRNHGVLVKFPKKKQDLRIDLPTIGLKTLKQSKTVGLKGIVVKNKKVISIEGKGGTKKMLEKSKSKIFRNHGVLVKFPKKKQDLRVDLPTIGLKTIKQSKIAGLKGIVIKNKQHVFLDKIKCIKFANRNKMFISVK